MATRRPKQILEWMDNRKDGNGITVTLAGGYAFSNANKHTAAHQRTFPTLPDAHSGTALKRLQRCTCDRCDRLIDIQEFE